MVGLDQVPSPGLLFLPGMGPVLLPTPEKERERGMIQLTWNPHPPQDQGGSVHSPAPLEEGVGTPHDTFPLGASAISPMVDGAKNTSVSPLEEKLRCTSSDRLATLQRTTVGPQFPLHTTYQGACLTGGSGGGHSPTWVLLPPSL